VRLGGKGRFAELRLLVHLETAILDRCDNAAEIGEMIGQVPRLIAVRRRDQPLGRKGIRIGVDLACRALGDDAPVLFGADRLHGRVIAEIDVTVRALQFLQKRVEAAAGFIELSRKIRLPLGKEGGMASDCLEAAALDPAIGTIRSAQAVGGRAVGECQAVELRVQEDAPERPPGEHPSERAGSGARVALRRLLQERAAHSLRPVAATLCTKLRRRMTKRVMEGISTVAHAALRRPRSTVKPVWKSASPTSIV